MKRAFITGITGQDGSYLTELFVEKKGYKVYGLKRRTATPNYENIKHIKKNEIEFISGDLTDVSSLVEAIQFF
ncbi:hypothetical protein GCM10020331_052630 [Ectobacillus funiculus]